MKKQPRYPDPIPENPDMTVEIALTDLSGAINFLKRKGVDRRIIADTIINAMEYGELNYLASDIDSFLRGKIWK